MAESVSSVPTSPVPAIRPDRFGRVAVLMGGWSAERDVSLMSGEQVHAALCQAGVDAHAIDADRDVVSRLRREGYARAFIALHGRGGEDGTVQGALDLAGIPYTGSGVLGCAIAMDKWRSKALCVNAGVPTPEARLVRSRDEAEVAATELGLPVVIKPVHEGSSIGVSMVHGEQMIAPAFDEAERYGTVMVERFMSGREITAGIVGSRCLPLITMKGSGEFYDYEAKYLAADTEYLCPAPLDADLTREIQGHALRAFEAIGCRGWGRVDFMLDAADRPQFIECNTAPGMTSHSLVPMAAAGIGIDFPSLCVSILADTLDATELAA